MIKCIDAAFAYDGNIAVSELNFGVDSGDYLCVTGENGSGKSTLIKGLLRLKRPVSGSVIFNGLSPREVGYIPQQTAAQKDFPASCREVVLSGRLGQRGVKPFYSRADRLAAYENMQRFGVYELRGRCFGELSGGQRQRVLLARALCAARKLLLLDEPAAGLDSSSARELYQLIGKLNREDGITVVMVTHDIQNALKYAGHILHLKKTQLYHGTSAGFAASEYGKNGGAADA